MKNNTKVSFFVEVKKIDFELESLDFDKQNTMVDLAIDLRPDIDRCNCNKHPDFEKELWVCLIDGLLYITVVGCCREFILVMADQNIFPDIFDIPISYCGRLDEYSALFN